jgi:cytochrome c55X
VGREKYLVALLLIPFGGQALAAEPSVARQNEIRHLVLQDCGSCHGMSMAGGLGLPLLPEALRDKPKDSLVATILHGRPGTAMPPWKPFLTESEAEWIVDLLLKGQF